MTTTVFFVSTAHPMAGPYFRQFPSEPIPGQGFLSVTNVVALPDNNVETLLRAIVAARVPRGGSIIVVSHGTPQGIQFVFRMARNTTLNAGTLQLLREHAEGRHDDVETARRMGYIDRRLPNAPVQVAWLNDMKALLRQVQDLNLSRVDLRACNTGQSIDTMRRLQWFFNADLCCAPDSSDTYGPLPLTVIMRNTRDWGRFLATHPTVAAVDTGTHRYALAYQVIGDARVNLESMASSPAAVDAWARVYLPPKITTTNVAVAYHGLIPDQRTIIFAGQTAYRDHLVAVTDGKGATVPVTTNNNDALPRERVAP